MAATVDVRVVRRTTREAATAASLSCYDRFRGQRYFPALDGIRAVAIILVFTAHVGYTAFWRTFFGGNGVTVFFVLSGFLISTLALREEDRRGALSLKSFYIRRLFRIYPMYLVVLALYCVLVYGAGLAAARRGLFTEQLPYYLLGFPEHDFFQFHALASAPPYAGAWSIGIEEKFYLVWPLLGFVALRGALRARIVTCLIAGVLFAAAPLGWDGGIYLFNYVFIVLGALMALLLHNRPSCERLRPLGYRPILLGLFAAFVGLQFFIVAYNERNEALLLIDGVVIALALVGVVLSSGRESRWLRSRPMVFLGQISYVFYLTHNFALNLVEGSPLGQKDLLHSLGDVVVAFALAVLIAWGLHVAVEKPFIRIGHRRAHREKPFHAV